MDTIFTSIEMTYVAAILFGSFALLFFVSIITIASVFYVRLSAIPAIVKGKIFYVHYVFYGCCVFMAILGIFLYNETNGGLFVSALLLNIGRVVLNFYLFEDYKFLKQIGKPMRVKPFKTHINALRPVYTLITQVFELTLFRKVSNNEDKVVKQKKKLNYYEEQNMEF